MKIVNLDNLIILKIQKTFKICNTWNEKEELIFSLVTVEKEQFTT